MGIAAQIKELLPLSFSYSEIAKSLSVTKGVISGQIARMRARGELQGLELVPVMRVPREDPPVKMIVDYERLTLQVSVDGGSEPLPSNFAGVHLLKLKPQDCRYIIGRYNSNHYYCAKPRKGVKSSYCEEHHALIWNPPPKRVRTPAKERKGGWDRPYKIGEAR